MRFPYSIFRYGIVYEVIENLSQRLSPPFLRGIRQFR